MAAPRLSGFIIGLSRFLLFGILVIVGTSCVDPFSPEVDDPNRQLVVDAVLEDGPGPHRVVLRRAGAYEQSLRGLDTPVRDADVSIRSDDGTVALLQQKRPENEPGVYETDVSAIVGTVGRTYSLRIELPGGTVYESTPETMRPVPELDSLYAQTSPVTPGGIDVIASFDEPDTERQYYRWSVDGTYAYAIQSSPCGGGPNSGDVDICFAVDSSPGVNLNVTDDRLINGQRVQRQIRRFESRSGFLRFPYALRVSQQSLSPRAYEFWSAVEQQVTESGTTFGSAPTQIIGNIANVDDEQDTALGYFQVSASSEKSLCIDRREFPEYARQSDLACTSSCQREVLESTTVELPKRTEICPEIEGDDDTSPPPFF